MKNKPLQQPADPWTRIAAKLFETLSDSFEQRVQQLEDIIAVIPPNHPMSAKARELLGHLGRHQILQRELYFQLNEQKYSSDHR